MSPQGSTVNAATEWTAEREVHSPLHLPVSGPTIESVIRVSHLDVFAGFLGRVGQCLLTTFAARH
jgi:hypothetical protein